MNCQDLLFIDPDDSKPVEEVCKFYQYDVNFVYSDTSLTEMLDEFKSGEKGHMAVVQEVNIYFSHVEKNIMTDLRTGEQ